jgi:hypothetical protein
VILFFFDKKEIPGPSSYFPQDISKIETNKRAKIFFI